MFSKGDLIHIPQSAVLYGLGQNSIYINKKPTLALFVNYAEEGFSHIIMNGKKWLIKSREIYLT